MEAPRKIRRKLLYHSDFALALTGFGRSSKCLLSYLYSLNKFDIYHYCCGVNYSNPELSKTPWVSRGCLPDNQNEMEQIQRDPNLARNASYGGYFIDRIIDEVKPDIYIGCQDFWFNDSYIYDKYWWNKIPCVTWSSLDSLPILKSAVDRAPVIKNYWVWSSFAEKALHKLGHTHVKTVHGPIDDTQFYKLDNNKRTELREKFKIGKDTFVILDVFRSQLRKTVPNLIAGYKTWKKENPTVKSSLLFHTSYSEGWDINSLLDEYKVSRDEVLVTYVCRACKEYTIKNFSKHEEDCQFCGNKNSQITPNVGFGVSIPQLNEIYNLADVFVASRTSGAQEYPIIEAKLTELITLITNYSFGEELCQEGSGSLPLDYSQYYEIGTQFRKASTYPASIAKQLDKVYKMSPEDRRKMGKMAREWTVKNYSVKVIGKQIEDFLDSCEITNYDFSQPQIELKNPSAQIPNIEDNKTWIKTLYKEILKMDPIQDNDSGLLYWAEALSKGMKREEVELYFKNIATQENQKNSQNKQIPFEDVLIKNGNKNFLLVCKESAGDILYATALLKSLRNSYPSDKWNIYFACDAQFTELLEGNEFIDKILLYQPFMESEISCIGRGNIKGPFDGYCFLTVDTQRHLSYLSNHNISLSLT